MWTDSRKRAFVVAFLIICYVTVKVRQGYEGEEKKQSSLMRADETAGHSSSTTANTSPASSESDGAVTDTTDGTDPEALYDEDDSFEVLWNVHRKKIDDESYLFHVKIPKCADRSLSVFAKTDCKITVSKKEQTKEAILDLLLQDNTCRYIGAPLPYSTLVYNKRTPGVFGHIPLSKPPITMTFFCHPFDWILTVAKQYETLEEGFKSKTGLLTIDEVQARYLSIENLPPLSDSAIFSSKPQEKMHVESEKTNDYTLFIQQIEQRILNIDFFGISDYYEASICLLKYTFMLDGWQNCSVVCPSNNFDNHIADEERQLREQLAAVPKDIMKKAIVDYTFDSLIYSYGIRVFEFRLREMEKKTHSKLVCGPTLRNPYEATERYLRELVGLSN